ncbi:MAG: ATP synthase F1 subunit gamma [Chitinophagales bacterium]|nr:ATP synthase F1 subunit gamma [Bacteroidota bacterium]MCB9043206.1 ATP synthase F1 subunit gamma [Chitinophagales bacterium]
MPGKLKEVKTRINSVKSTQQITKAMKLVAASKLKKATDAIVQMRPYADKLGEVLRNISAGNSSDVEIVYAMERPIQRAAVVVITSDKGLCGSFNANILKTANFYIKNDLASVRKNGNLTIIPIGKKAYDAFKKYEDCKLVTDYVNLFKDLSYNNVSDVAKMLMNGFEVGYYDKVVVAYAEFKNAAVQNFNLVDFLPIAKKQAEEKQASNVDYIFEPDKAKLLKDLTPKILKTQFYSYLLDNNASEHGARMTAMDNATNNAAELLRQLQIKYNKERQAAITTELTEIVSGAAAL